MILIKENVIIKYLIFAIISIFIFSVAVTAASSSGNMGGELNGEKLIIEQIEGTSDQYIVKAEKNAVMKNKEITIKGDFARFNTNNRQVYFEDNVQLRNDSYLLAGNKLNGNLNDEEFSMEGDVKLTGDELKITAGSMIYQHSIQKAVLTDKPFIEYRKFKAESKKITYNMEDNKIYLTGDVSGKQNDREFSAEKVTIDLDKQKIEMSGGARFIFPDRGEDK